MTCIGRLCLSEGPEIIVGFLYSLLFSSLPTACFMLCADIWTQWSIESIARLLTLLELCWKIKGGPPPNENGPFCLRQYWSYLLSHVPLRNAANKGGNKARDVGHQMPRRGSQDTYCSIMQNNVWAHSTTPGTITKKWVNQRFNYSALPTDVVCGSSTWRSINSWFAMQMFIPANDKGGFCGVANRQEFWRKSDHEAVANRTGFCV